MTSTLRTTLLTDTVPAKFLPWNVRSTSAFVPLSVAPPLTWNDFAAVSVAFALVMMSAGASASTPLVAGVVVVVTAAGVPVVAHPASKTAAAAMGSSARRTRMSVLQSGVSGIAHSHRRMQRDAPGWPDRGHLDGHP